MKEVKTLVIGCSGSIGNILIDKIKMKNILFVSRKKPKKLPFEFWKKIDLNKNLDGIPKKAYTVIFLASPYYVLKNMNKKTVHQEFIWLKKILKFVEIKKIIYLSSSTIYLKKNLIGKTKLKCEKILNSSKIKYIQIWRPFNIIGKYEFNISDHFHNLLYKNYIIQNKLIYKFNGNENDKRGYSSSKKFCEKLLYYGKKNISFKKNYGNKNYINIYEVVNIFKEIFKNKLKHKIKIIFNNKKFTENTIRKKNTITNINSNENSKDVLKNYYKSLL